MQGKSVRHISYVPLILGIVAFACFEAGTWTARRDILLDGSFLYLTRFVQLGVYFVMAFLFRNHLPSVKNLTIVVVGTFAFHLALTLALGASTLPQSVFNTTSFLSSVFSGIASAGALLLLAHVFSSYAPRYSALAIAAAYLGTEVIFGATAFLPSEGVYAAQPLLKSIGLVGLVLCIQPKDQVSANECEHPLQFGIPDETPSGVRPLHFLTSNGDWAFQAIIALLVPFVFGFMSQLLSSNGLSDGLHDPNNEVIAVGVLIALTLFCALKGTSIGFNILFFSVMGLYAIGFLLFPLLLEIDSPYAGTLFKCGLVLYQPLLWILLARKSFDDPRHTYLYFGVFCGLANVSFGRFFGPFILPPESLDALSASYVSIVFLFAIAACVSILFFLQRTTYATRTSPHNEVDTAHTVAVSTPIQDDFAIKLPLFCNEANLTKREREVLVEILHGYSMSNTAKKLFLSPETVRTHMKNIYTKTGFPNKQALIQAVDEMHMPDPPSSAA